jgi:hypothetical protein
MQIHLFSGDRHCFRDTCLRIWTSFIQRAITIWQAHARHWRNMGEAVSPCSCASGADSRGIRQESTALAGKDRELGMLQKK